jgi:hypothetical protein
VEGVTIMKGLDARTDLGETLHVVSIIEHVLAILGKVKNINARLI